MPVLRASIFFSVAAQVDQLTIFFLWNLDWFISERACKSIKGHLQNNSQTYRCAVISRIVGQIVCCTTMLSADTYIQMLKFYNWDKSHLYQNFVFYYLLISLKDISPRIYSTASCVFGIRHIAQYTYTAYTAQ